LFVSINISRIFTSDKTNNDMRTKVEARLIAKGNNQNEVTKMMNLHFEYASSQYSTVKAIAECIRTIY
jgi:hypothetical protein